MFKAFISKKATKKIVIWFLNFTQKQSVK